MAKLFPPVLLILIFLFSACTLQEQPEAIKTPTQTIPSLSGEVIKTPTQTIPSLSGEVIKTPTQTISSLAGEVIKTPTQTIPSLSGEVITSTLQTIDLPSPRLKGKLSLEEALYRRRSVREFTEDQLTLEEIGQLLWAAQGITNSAGYRTAPSAGALYPLEVYVITQEGVYHYDPHGHRLSVHLPGDLRPELYAATLQQESVLNAPTVFVITAVYERTIKKYGEERSPLYVHLEAGHAAQNLLLQAVALDLAGVPIGGFYDDKVKTALSLPDDQQPLYLLPVGHPQE